MLSKYYKYSKLNCYDLLFYIPYILFISFSILNTSFFAVYIAGIKKVLFVCSIVLLLTREIAYGHYSFIRCIGYIFGLAIVAIIGITADKTANAMAIILIITIGKTDYQKVLRITQLLTIFLILIIIIAAQIGIIQSFVLVQNGRIRHALGFRYVLYLPTYLFNIIAIYVFLKRDRLKISMLLFYAIVAAFVFYLTDSRLVFYSTIFLILYSMMYSIKHNKNKVIEVFIGKAWFVFIPIFIILAGLSIYSIIHYNHNSIIQYRINSFLGGRLSISNLSYRLYGFSWLGNSNISWVGQAFDMYGNKADGTVTFVDNLYFNLLQKYGVLFLIAFLALLTIMMYRCYKSKEKMLFVILIIIAFHGVIDNLIEYLHFNSFLLFANYSYFKRIDKRTNICTDLIVDEPNKYYGSLHQSIQVND